MVRRQASAKISSSNCQAYQNSCHFYSHCIEQSFPCGHNHFITAYAEERCHEIDKLKSNPSSSDLYSVSLHAYLWAHAAESCFHQAIWQILNDKYLTQNKRADPQTCLEWERDVVNAMNTCYSDTGLAWSIGDLPDQDITQLVNIFRVGEPRAYFNRAVDSGIPELVKAGNAQLASSLVEQPVKYRYIYCIKGIKYAGPNEDATSPSPEDFIAAVKDGVNPPPGETDFHYSGPDEELEGLCFSHQPSNINSNTDDYHYVIWFTSNDTHPEINTPIDRLQTNGGVINAQMFELTNRGSRPREQTLCGDGIRQITEDCDFSSNHRACDTLCRVKPGFDCNVDQLEPSKCFREMCGDGMRTRGEECDDRNWAEGDGCSSSCRIEPLFQCTRNHYNATSDCSRTEGVSQLNKRDTRQASLFQEESIVGDRTFEFDSTSSSAGHRPVSSSLIIYILSTWLVCVLPQFLLNWRS